jgi:hypothetical protein
MSNDIFETLADTYYLATTLRVPARGAAKHREAPAEPSAATPQAGAEHPLLGGLLDLEVIRRFRPGAAARARGCG